MRFPGALAVMLLLLAGCGSSQVDPQGSEDAQKDPCYDSDIAAKRTWNKEAKIQVKAQVMEWGGEIGVDIAQQKALEITNSMDRLTDDWARMRKAVCKDHFVRDILTKDELKTRNDCLDRMLSRQRTFLTTLESPQVDVSEQLTAINEELMSCGQ